MNKPHHAIVIGGSMAGMCAARVLSDRFDKVTIVDRDTYPDGALERPGVPQSRHVHVMLARGRREIEGLFPGFEQVSLSRGALDLDFGWEFAALRVSGWVPREIYGIRLLHASRVLIEAVVRELLRKIPNVAFIENTRVRSLVVNEDHSRVLGVRTTPAEAGGQDGELRADLVVDASGRSSKAPNWFEEIGLPAPEEIIVDSHSAYASRWFQAPEPEARPKEWWWKGAWVDPKLPDSPFAGVLFPVENNRWVVTVAGLGRNYPPPGEEGYIETMRKLRSPIIYEAVQRATPISPIYSNRAMANRWRRYDRWGARLDGFVALGDAMCAFNPAYGQGMTTGALSALSLRDAIEKWGLDHPEFTRKFFAAQAEVQKGPWGMATGADFSIPGTLGHKPLSSKIFDPLVGLIMERSFDDPVVRLRMGEVIHMLRPPSDLFAPALLARVVVASLRHALKGKPASTAYSAMPPAQWADATPA